MTTDHLTRQLEIIPLEILGEKITIIGAGAIGSWTALALAKMGFGDITVIDFDSIEVENMNSQFYPLHSIGSPKVTALAKLVAEFTGVFIKARHEMYIGGWFPGIVISAVDSMAVRQLIWDAHKDHAVGCRGIIDPRMGAETALLYVMDPMREADHISYEKTLYSDIQAVQERCTAKATIYTANMLSGLVCKAVKDLLTRPDYLRSAEWNINANAFLGHSRKVS